MLAGWISLVPEARIPVAQKELSGSLHSSGLPSSSHHQPGEPSAEASTEGALGVVIPAEADRREALLELNERLTLCLLNK